MFVVIAHHSTQNAKNKTTRQIIPVTESNQFIPLAEYGSNDMTTCQFFVKVSVLSLAIHKQTK